MNFPKFFSTIESDLEEILAPLTKLKTRLDAFIVNAQDNIKKEQEIIDQARSNMANHVTNIGKANSVKINFESLLGGL